MSVSSIALITAAVPAANMQVMNCHWGLQTHLSARGGQQGIYWCLTVHWKMKTWIHIMILFCFVCPEHSNSATAIKG